MPTLILGAGLLALLLVLRRFGPKAPASLIACVVAIAVSDWLKLPARGLAVVGAVSGAACRVWPFRRWTGAIRRAFSRGHRHRVSRLHRRRPAGARVCARNHYEVSPNRELAALGAANLVNGFFQGFAVTGSQSRTAINDAAGGKTQLASFVMAASTALFLLYLTPLLASLPLVALGAILIYGGWRLVEFDAMKRIYRYYPAAAALRR